MKGTEMHSRKSKSAILLLILGSLLVTILLAACGDATATTGPAAQPTATVPASTTVPTTTKPVTTTAATTAPTTTKPVGTTAPAPTTAATTTKPVTTASPTQGPTSTATPDEPTVPPTTKSGSTTLGQPFDLKMGQSMTLTGTNLTVKFAQISEDSRCPNANLGTGHSVECFWSGQVTADIKVSMDNGRVSQNVKLTLPGSVNTKTTSKTTVGNYQLEVKEILPKKFLDVDIQPGDYAVTLVITTL